MYLNSLLSEGLLASNLIESPNDHILDAPTVTPTRVGTMTVYASLIKVLEDRELIRFGPFDATCCRNSSVEDLDNDKISRFLGLARRGRSFPLPDNTAHP